MFDDVSAQLKIFVGLIGAFLAAAIGALARHVYAENGFSWQRALWDVPFAMLCALVVGGLGEVFHVTPIVVYGAGGAAGYLGPQWLSDFMKRRAAQAAGDDEEGENV